MLAAVGIIVLVAATAGGLSRLHLDTTVSSVSAQDGSVRTWTQEQQSFGGDPIAVLLTSKQPAQLLSGQPVFNLLALEERLSQLGNVSVVYGPATTLNEIVISVKHLVQEITDQSQTVASQAEAQAAGAGASPAAQQAAGQAAQQAFDVRYGSLLTQGLKLGLPSLSNASYGPTVFLPGGKARPAFHWLVPDPTHVAILIRPSPNLSQSGTGSLVRQVRAAVKGAGLPLASSEVTGQPVIAAALATEVVNELPLLAPIVVAVVALCFFVTRRRVRWWERLLPLAVGLVATGLTMAVFGWSGVPLSIGLLAFLPIILGVGTDYPIYALRNGRPRQILAAVVASGSSLALLASSPLPFVRDLGLALVVGLVLSALLGLGVARLVGLGGGRPPQEPVPVPQMHLPARSGRSRRRWLAGSALALAAGVVGWSFLASLPLDSDPQSLAAGLPALRQGVEAQSILGASGELDIYLRGANVLTPAYLAWYDRSQTTLVAHHGKELDPIVSPASLLSWLGPNPSPAEIDSALGLLPSYLTTVTVRDDQGQSVMAFGVKLGSLEDESKLITSVKKELPPLPAGATMAITGLPAVAAHSNDLLSGDRIVPNVASIGAFGLVLVLILQRRRDALVAVTSAALATGWGFAVLKATGTPLTPLTVSLGSLTSAVGGEFAVMALGRYATGQSRPWSAVVAAATTSVVGFAVLAFSRLNLLRQFGLVLAGSVLLALLAAWVVVSVSRVTWRADRTPKPVTAADGPGHRGPSLAEEARR
jgi:hypothetical protein